MAQKPWQRELKKTVSAQKIGAAPGYERKRVALAGIINPNATKPRKRLGQQWL